MKSCWEEMEMLVFAVVQPRILLGTHFGREEECFHGEGGDGVHLATARLGCHLSSNEMLEPLRCHQRKLIKVFCAR